MKTSPQKDKTGWKEVGWFVLLWAAGVATIAAVGLLIRWVLMD